MTLTIVLFGTILLLLAVIVAMMVTGWPGRELAEIEKAGDAMRREMAEHRADSIQLLHAIRIEVEDSVKESIEREMAGYGSRGGRSRGPKKTPKALSGDDAMPAVVAAPQFADPDTFDDAPPESILAARQLPLFGENPVAATHPDPAPNPPEAARPAPPEEPEPEPHTIFVGYIDDIPDVE